MEKQEYEKKHPFPRPVDLPIHGVYIHNYTHTHSTTGLNDVEWTLFLLDSLSTNHLVLGFIYTIAPIYFHLLWHQASRDNNTNGLNAQTH